MRADDPDVAFWIPSEPSGRTAWTPLKKAAVAFVMVAAVALCGTMWSRTAAEPVAELTPSRQAALEFSIDTQQDHWGAELTGGQTGADRIAKSGVALNQTGQHVWQSAAGLIPSPEGAGPDEMSRSTVPKARSRPSQDTEQPAGDTDKANKDVDTKLNVPARRVRMGFEGGLKRIDIPRARSSIAHSKPAAEAVAADEPPSDQIRISLSAKISSNTTITRRRQTRGPRHQRPRVDLSKCTRGISTLVKNMKDRVGNGTFVTKEDAQLLNGKEKYLQGHNWVLPDNPVAARGGFKFHRCAVVGNSGHLRLTSYGYAIDQFDVVMRTNQAPTKGYGKYIGTKTTHRLINRSIAKYYIRALVSRQKRLAQVKKQIETSLAQEDQQAAARHLLQLSTSGHPILQAFGIDDALLERVNHSRPKLRDEIASVLKGVRGNSLALSSNGERMLFPLEPNLTMVLITEKASKAEDTRRFFNAVHPLRPDVKTLAQGGKMRRASEQMLTSWTAKQKPCTGRDSSKYNLNRGTTGLLAVTSMLHLCKKVVLFGFGMPQEGTKAAPYHYYSGLRNRSWKSKSSKVHNFPGEASLIRGLVSEGLVEMCNEASLRTCGLSKMKIAKLAAAAGTQPIVVGGVSTLPPEVELPEVIEVPDDDEPEALEDPGGDAEDEQNQAAEEGQQ